MIESDLSRDKTVTRAIHNLFWRAMFKQRIALFITYLCNIPSFFIFNVLLPLHVAYGIQAIIASDVARVQHQAIIIVVITVVNTLLFAIGTYSHHRVNVDGAVYVQREVFNNYLSKDIDFYASRQIGALGADAMSLRAAFQDYSLQVTQYVPRLSIVVVLGTLLIAIKSPPLGAVTAVFVGIIVAETAVVAQLRLKYRRRVSQARSQLAGAIGDPLSQAPSVKSFAQEAYENHRLSGPLTLWRNAQIKTFDTSIPHTMLRHSLLGLTMAGLLVVSVHLYIDHRISIAIVALVQLYVIRVVTASVEIGEVLKDYESLMGDAYEPMATMLVPTVVTDRPAIKHQLSTVKKGIAFNAVSYHYNESSTDALAVDDFTLDITSGEKIGLIGLSGGGKTTITKLLLRFMDVSEGAITIDGVDIRDYAQSNLRQAIAYVPQEPVLFHRSIKENIAYARPNASTEDILKAAKTAYVDEFVKPLPFGYEAMVGERGVKLSGGQRQRVAIARALLKQSPILVLDEATSALDSQSEQYIQKALWELMKGKTAIVIAHRLSTIQHMDRIVVIDKGKIVQIGSHQELLKNQKGIYAKLWAHQSGGYLSDGVV